MTMKTYALRASASHLNLALCLGLVTASAIVGATGCASQRAGRTAGEYIDDQSLQSRVHNSLNKDPDYKFDRVQVSVFRGTVQLSGFVDLADARNRAQQIVQQVPGVKKIENSIAIAAENARPSASDSSLASQVRTALADDPEYKFNHVNVTVADGTVQLSGFVDSADQRSKAADVAQHVSGAGTVQNNITIKNNTNL